MIEVTYNLNLHPVSGGRTSAAVSRCHQRRTYKSHILYYVRQESLPITVGTVPYLVNEGQFLVLPRNVEHYGHAPYKRDFKIYWAAFDIGDSEFDSVFSFPLYGTAKRPHILEELMRDYVEYWTHTYVLQKKNIELTLLQIFLEISGNHHETGILPQTNIVLAKKTKDIIHHQYTQEINTSIIAQQLGYCPDYLGRVYRSVFGVTISDEINHIRNRAAAKLLIETNLGIDQIGFKVGYNDKSHFRVMFRRAYMTTPSKYRKLHSRFNNIINNDTSDNEYNI